MRRLKNKQMEKIGFDYDGVLSDKPIMVLLAKSFLPAQLYIITKRSPDVNDLEHGSVDVLKMADELKISYDKVHFTNQGPKSPIINQEGITRFYDDQLVNKQEIELNSNCKVILVK
jgi:uncharacterized HAD superfamily protein